MISSIFTVGIPTFNRGACARKLVTKLLPVLPDGTCIWVSDNGSTREVEDYDAIRLLALKYPQPCLPTIQFLKGSCQIPLKLLRSRSFA